MSAEHRIGAMKLLLHNSMSSLQVICEIIESLQACARFCVTGLKHYAGREAISTMQAFQWCNLVILQLTESL